MEEAAMTETSPAPNDVKSTATPPAPQEAARNEIEPLPGEHGISDVAAQAREQRASNKARIALVLFVLSAMVVTAMAVQRTFSPVPAEEPHEIQPNRNRPAATMGGHRQLDLSGLPPVPGVAGTASAPSAAAAPAMPMAASGPRIPAITGMPDDRAEPIGVRRTTSTAPVTASFRLPPPEDAPVLLASIRPGAVAAASPPIPPSSEGKADPLAATQRNLQAYQAQLQGLMDTLSRTTTAATTAGTRSEDAPVTPSSAPSTPPSTTRSTGTSPTASASSGTSSSGLFGGQLQGSATPRVSATMLGDRSLTLPKGTAFTCALKTRLISATSGLVGCQVQRNVYGDDGRVLLIERGSHLDGEYRIASVKPGTVRIPVLWTRLRTPLGVTVDIESPGTGPLGESGIDGHVDNRWDERIGAAMLLSLIDDSVKLVIQQQSGDGPANGAGNGGSTVVLPSTTAQTSKLAEKVLESTINIPPLIYQNQGGVVGIYVARDVNFGSVYELRPEPVEPGR
ncbi:TrbI/VirB10 family protein [Leptothrix sp. BB-4]